MKKGKKYGLGHGQQRSQSRRKRASGTRVEVDITKKPDDINKPVIHNGKQWWWCSDETGGKCGGVLRRHNPKECKGIGVKSVKSDSQKTPGKGRKNLNLKISEAIINGGGSDSDDSDQESATMITTEEV